MFYPFYRKHYYKSILFPETFNHFFDKNNPLTGLIVTIIGDFIFVPESGIIAVALVSTISYTVNTAFVMSFYYRGHPLHFSAFFKWRKSDYDWLFSMLKAMKG